MDPRDGEPDAAPTAVTPVPAAAIERDADPTRFNPARRAALAGGIDLRHRDDPDAAGDGDVEDDPDGEPTALIAVPSHRRGRDWNWVEEWRSDGDRPAWAPGISVGVFVAAIVAVALIVLTDGVADDPILAVIINVVIALGMAPALWLSRSLPVLRFLAGGAAAGLLIGWIWMLATFTGGS